MWLVVNGMVLLHSLGKVHQKEIIILVSTINVEWFGVFRHRRKGPLCQKEDLTAKNRKKSSPYPLAAIIGEEGVAIPATIARNSVAILSLTG